MNSRWDFLTIPAVPVHLSMNWGIVLPFVLLLSSLFSIYIPRRRALYPQIYHFVSRLSESSMIVLGSSTATCVVSVAVIDLTKVLIASQQALGITMPDSMPLHNQIPLSLGWEKFPCLFGLYAFREVTYVALRCAVALTFCPLSVRVWRGV